MLHGAPSQLYSVPSGLLVPPSPVQGSTGSGGGGPGTSSTSGKGPRPISPAIIQCGITDEELVTLSVRDLNRALKMRGLTRDEIVTMKQRSVHIASSSGTACQVPSYECVSTVVHSYCSHVSDRRPRRRGRSSGPVRAVQHSMHGPLDHAVNGIA